MEEKLSELKVSVIWIVDKEINGFGRIKDYFLNWLNRVVSDLHRWLDLLATLLLFQSFKESLLLWCGTLLLRWSWA